jgi:feruloyl esterase
MFHRWMVVTSLALATPAVLVAQQSCEKLAELKLPTVTITSAESLPAAPASGAGTRPSPARCVVKAVARPTSDSEIKFEVWLPEPAAWNGRYQQAGNGGWAGSIPGPSLATAVQRGYAAAGTDDGHVGGTGAAWAIGHPEKFIDFGYRAVHETTVHSKAILRAYYGRDAQHNFFVGCSDGGREALMEAQRYPEDFDGIISGAPAYAWSHGVAGFIWNEQALLKDAASAIPPAKLAAVQKASVAACDALDGVKDGLIEDPRACHFDPAVITCKGPDSNDCLTAPQVTALKQIYAGPKNPRTGKQIYPGFSPGTEAVPGTWSWVIGAVPDRTPQFMFGNTYFGQAVYEDPQWDFRKLNFDSDLEFSDQKGGSVLNATNPDLRSFRAHGGKLIQYHGWGDVALAPVGSIEYYEQVVAFLGKYPDPRNTGSTKVEDFYRLFMVPGMGHCAGGLGPNSFGNAGPAPVMDADHDIIMALERWVEKGVAPEKIIGTGPVAGDPSKKLTRPLCPYPKTARYNGTGDPNDASSFTCAVAPASH